MSFDYLWNVPQLLKILSNYGMISLVYKMSFFAKKQVLLCRITHKGEMSMKQKLSILKEKKVRRLIILIVAALVVGLVVFGIIKIATPKVNEPEVVTVSTLEKIINVSELSTFTAVYNGIAQVMNEKNPEEIDYYVSYEARVNAGVDFEKIVISVDNEEKIIQISIPEVYITDVNVDIASVDFIFYNDKANTSTVTEAAFKACENDVKGESEKQAAILDLTKQNAINILTALVKPIVEQMDAEYQLVVN